MKLSNISLSKITWYCFLTAFPLSAFASGNIPFLGQSGFYAYGGANSICLAAVLLPCALSGIMWGLAVLRGELKLRHKKASLFLLALAILTIPSIFVAIDREVALFGSAGPGLGTLAYIGFFLLAFLALQLVSSQKRLVQLGRAIVATGVVVALLALCEVAGLPVNAPLGESWQWARGISTLRNSDKLGTFLVVPLLIACGMLPFSAHRSKSSTEDESSVPHTPHHESILLFLTAIPIIGCALVFTMTRGAWIGALFGIVLLSFFAWQQYRQKKDGTALRRIGLLWIAAVLVSVLFITVVPSFLPHIEFTQRIKTAVSDLFVPEQTLGGRGTTWSIGADLVAKSPLLGLGADNLRYVAEAHPNIGALGASDHEFLLDTSHNMYLEFALNFGLPFALLLIGIAVSAYYQSTRMIRRARGTEMQVLIAYLVAFAGLSVAFITAVVNPAIMALYFVLFGVLCKSLADFQNSPLSEDASSRPTILRRFALNDSRKSQIIAASFVIVLSLMFSVYALLTGLSALAGNHPGDSLQLSINRSEAALRIAPWRKEPVEEMRVAIAILYQRREIPPQIAYEQMGFVSKHEPHAMRPHIFLAEIAFYEMDDAALAREHLRRALEIRPSSSTVQEFLAIIGK
jgi:O-antigen ligase